MTAVNLIRLHLQQIGTLEDMTTVVTDEKPEDKWLQVFKEFGMSVSSDIVYRMKRGHYEKL